VKKVVIISSVLGIAVFLFLFLSTCAVSPTDNLVRIGGQGQASGAFAAVVFLISYGIGAGIVKYRQRRWGY